MLTQAPIVQPPDWTRPSHVFVDDSDIAIGTALMQHTELNWYRSVYYSNRKLSTVKQNYSTKEHEPLGMIYSIYKFRHYLLGKKFTFHIDHTGLNITHLFSLICLWCLCLVLSRRVGDLRFSSTLLFLRTVSAFTRRRTSPLLSFRLLGSRTPWSCPVFMHLRGIPRQREEAKAMVRGPASQSERTGETDRANTER